MSDKLKRQWRKFNVKDLKRIIKEEKLGKVSKLRKDELINVIIHKGVDITKYKSSRVKKQVSEERKQVLREQLKRAREKKQKKKKSKPLESIKEEPPMEVPEFKMPEVKVPEVKVNLKPKKKAT
jgi:hypothetical protein